MSTSLDLPVWIINLKRDTDRRTFMEKRMYDLGIDYEIIEAKDGNNLSSEDFQHYSKKLAVTDFGRELKNTEIGCALSHIHLWERIIKENVNEVLIMEDDVYFGEGLLELVIRRNQFPKEYDHINFLTKAKQHPIGNYIFDIYRVSKHMERAYGTVCYLLTNSGARKLLKSVYPIYMPIDNYLSLINLNSYGIFPQAVVLANFDSSIGRRWDPLPKPSYLLRKYRELKAIVKSIAIFWGFNDKKLIELHIKMNNFFRKMFIKKAK